MTSAVRGWGRGSGKGRGREDDEKQNRHEKRAKICGAGHFFVG